MSIEFLFELERTLDKGQKIYGCAASQQGRWELATSIEAIRKAAKRTAIAKKGAVQIMQLLPASSNVPDGSLLIAAKIGEEEAKKAGNITWSTVGSVDAAETMRDVRHGPSPFFALQFEETTEPS